MKFDVIITGPGGVLPTILGYKERKSDMGELNPEQKEYYVDIANKHANFLAEKVFKPAFIMGFVHGVKHGRKDATAEMNAKLALHCKKADLKDALNRNHPLRIRNEKKPVEVTTKVINIPKRPKKK